MFELLETAEAGDTSAVLQVLQVNPRLIGREGVNRVFQRAITEPNQGFVKDLPQIGSRPLLRSRRRSGLFCHCCGIWG
jgi:hypothetical protein